MPENERQALRVDERNATDLISTSPNEPNHLFEILGDHALSEIATLLGDYLGVGVDRISLMIFMALASGRLGIPLNLAIFSDDPAAEGLITDRVVNILPETVKHVDTIKQFRDLVDADFKDTEVVVLRSLHENLVRYASEAATRDTGRVSPPSVLTISDKQTRFPQIGPTLSLMARQTDRSLSGFGYHFSRLQGTEASPAFTKLRQVLLQVKHRREYRCPFRDQLRAGIKPSDALILNRLLMATAALRIELSNVNGEFKSDSETAITIPDYRVTRELLNSLPIPRELSKLTPYAAETGTILFEAFAADPKYQNTIPDNNDFGRKVFTRSLGMEQTGLSHNTVKAHLKQLIDEGIVESRIVRESQKHARIRRQGIQVYYRFAESRSPPFGANNPFSGLPKAEEIADD